MSLLFPLCLSLGRVGSLGLVALAASTLLLAGSAQAGMIPVKDPATGRTYALVSDRGSLGRPGARARALSVSGAKVASEAFLHANREAIGWTNPAVELAPGPVNADQVGKSHIRYSQRYRGLTVFGGDVSVHIDPNGEVYYATTKLAQQLPADVTPRVFRAQAMHVARAQGERDSPRPASMVAGEPKLLLLALGLVKHTGETDARLTWEVAVHDAGGGDLLDRTYYVDAVTGAVVFELSNRAYLDRQVYDCANPSGNCALDLYDAGTNYWYGRSENAPARGISPYPGATDLTCFDGGQPYANADVDSLHSKLLAVHNFVFESFGLDGASNQGGTGIGGVPPSQTLGYVHYDTQGGLLCPRSAQFVFATGEVDFCNANASNDMVGHEYGHAIAQHAMIAHGYPSGPTYFGQTGALNEAFADVFGEAFENRQTGSNDWLIGTGLACDGNNSLLRSLKSPASSGPPPNSGPPSNGVKHPPRWYSRWVYCGSNPLVDQGGVHINSTVISHAFYRMAVGGDAFGCQVAPIGLEAAKQIFYRSWRYYFNANESFAQAWLDIQQAAADLYPPDTTDQVRIALQAAEIDLPGICSGQPEPTPNCYTGGPFIADAHAGRPTYPDTDWSPTNSFAPSETLTVRGSGNVPNRPFRLFFRIHASSISTPPFLIGGDAFLNAGPFVQPYIEPATTGPLGEFSVTFHSPLQQNAAGATAYDVFIDGNNDGMWEPWIDLALPITLKPAVNGDGSCYQGQFYSTSENCNGSPVDCACAIGSTCQQDAQGRWSCVSTTGVDGPALPRQFSLGVSGANPGRGSVHLEAALPRASAVDVTIYGVHGGVVRRVMTQAQLPAGTHAIAWDGRDDRGQAAAGGVYFVRMHAGGAVFTRTVVLIR